MLAEFMKFVLTYRLLGHSSSRVPSTEAICRISIKFHECIYVVNMYVHEWLKLVIFFKMSISQILQRFSYI